MSSKDVPRKLIQCDDDREQIECRGRFMLVVQCSGEFCCLRDDRGITVLNDGIERASPEPKAMSLSSGRVMTAVLKPKFEDILIWKSIGDFTFRKFKIPSQIINEQVEWNGVEQRHEHFEQIIADHQREQEPKGHGSGQELRAKRDCHDPGESTPWLTIVLALLRSQRCLPLESFQK